MRKLMKRLEELKKKNPGMEIFCVCEDAFKPYGRMIDIDVDDMCEAALANAPIPAEGSSYVTVLSAIDTMKEADTYRAVLAGQLDEQFGLCWGHNSYLNALEWHTCNEFNFGATDAVLFLAKRADIDADGELDSAKVKAFYLPKGAAIEVYSDTLHYCPCEVSKDGFSVVIGLQRGTNEDLDPAAEHDPLVTAKNKWLISHKSQVEADSPHAKIYGENLKLNTID